MAVKGGVVSCSGEQDHKSAASKVHDHTPHTHHHHHMRIRVVYECAADGVEEEAAIELSVASFLFRSRSSLVTRVGVLCCSPAGVVGW